MARKGEGGYACCTGEFTASDLQDCTQALLYREYGLQETILIVLGIVFCVWLFERV